MCSKNDTQNRVVLCLYSHNLEMGTMPSSEVFDYYKHLCSDEVPYSVCRKCWVRIQQQKEPGTDPQMFCIDTLRRAESLCTKGDSIEMGRHSIRWRPERSCGHPSRRTRPC